MLVVVVVLGPYASTGSDPSMSSLSDKDGNPGSSEADQELGWSKVGPKKGKKKGRKMIGFLWNIRGLGTIGRIPALKGRIRDNHVSFLGIMETKKKDLSSGLLKNLVDNIPFSWCQLEPKGSAGGILVGANADMFNMVVKDILKFSISVMLTCKKSGFVWKLVVVYGPAYDDLKQDFLEELDVVMSAWQGPTLVGGDFNLIRFTSDKSNGVINHRWADSFNSWVDKWALVELNAGNKRFTWTNNQEHPIMAKIDRIFVSTSWEAAFPLVNVKALERLPSDHNPLLLDSGDNATFSKKKGLDRKMVAGEGVF